MLRVSMAPASLEFLNTALGQYRRANNLSSGWNRGPLGRCAVWCGSGPQTAARRVRMAGAWMPGLVERRWGMAIGVEGPSADCCRVSSKGPPIAGIALPTGLSFDRICGSKPLGVTGRLTLFRTASFPGKKPAQMVARHRKTCRCRKAPARGVQPYHGTALPLLWLGDRAPTQYRSFTDALQIGFSSLTQGSTPPHALQAFQAPDHSRTAPTDCSG
jgi:hypothetical protein